MCIYATHATRPNDKVHTLGLDLVCRTDNDSVDPPRITALTLPAVELWSYRSISVARA